MEIEKQNLEKEILSNKGNKAKKKNGITLIALTITIIVLLILAGVAIRLTLRRKRDFKKNTRSGIRKYERNIL